MVGGLDRTGVHRRGESADEEVVLLCAGDHSVLDCSFVF